MNEWPLCVCPGMLLGHLGSWSYHKEGGCKCSASGTGRQQQLGILPLGEASGVWPTHPPNGVSKMESGRAW